MAPQNVRIRSGVPGIFCQPPKAEVIENLLLARNSMRLLIVAASSASRVFLPGDANYADLHHALLAGKKFNVAAVHGGKLTQEYGKLASLRGILNELARAGRLRLFTHKAVDAETRRVAPLKVCSIQRCAHHRLGANQRNALALFGRQGALP